MYKDKILNKNYYLFVIKNSATPTKPAISQEENKVTKFKDLCYFLFLKCLLEQEFRKRKTIFGKTTQGGKEEGAGRGEGGEKKYVEEKNRIFCKIFIIFQLKLLGGKTEFIL